MPAPTRPSEPSRQHDIDGLVHFFRTLERVLDVTIRTRGLFIPGKLYASFLAAWTEARPSIREIIRMIQSGQHAEHLQQVGLSGVQLAMKLATYQEALEGLIAFFSENAIGGKSTPIKEATPVPEEGKWKKLRKRGRQLLQNLFKPANIILGSITKAIPLAEILHELKGSVETALSHADLYEELEKETPSKPESKQWNKLASIVVAMAKWKPQR